MSLDRRGDRPHPRRSIQSGELPPGSRLPPEQQLAAELGLSRNIMREAVKALVVARVLDVRRGDGTYVTSLEPRLLLEGLGFAVELLQGDTLLELIEVRRLFEPAATGAGRHPHLRRAARRGRRATWTAMRAAARRRRAAEPARRRVPPRRHRGHRQRDAVHPAGGHLQPDPAGPGLARPGRRQRRRAAR